MSKHGKNNRFGGKGGFVPMKKRDRGQEAMEKAQDRGKRRGKRPQSQDEANDEPVC